MPRLDVGKTKPDPKRDEDYPPGRFVSHELEADCSRFLQEIKDSIRRRSEASLDRVR